MSLAGLHPEIIKASGGDDGGEVAAGADDVLTAGDTAPLVCVIIWKLLLEPTARHNSRISLNSSRKSPLFLLHLAQFGAKRLLLIKK